MKKLFTLTFTALVLLTGCKKKEINKCPYTLSDLVAPASEQQALQDSLTAHGIDATMAPAGFFYKINQQGTGSGPSNPCSTVAVYYRGGFLNGSGFDSSGTYPVVFQLGQVIPGWQKALPMVGIKGDMTLYIPPSLAYGNKDFTDRNGNVIIPANSNLVFRVKVEDIQ